MTVSRYCGKELYYRHVGRHSQSQTQGHLVESRLDVSLQPYEKRGDWTGQEGRKKRGTRCSMQET